MGWTTNTRKLRGPRSATYQGKIVLVHKFTSRNLVPVAIIEFESGVIEDVFVDELMMVTAKEISEKIKGDING